MLIVEHKNAESRRMRLEPFQKLFCWMPVVLLLACSGCEVGHRWFSMSSDSPMPWFGFDLMPRRKTTTQILTPGRGEEPTREVTSWVSLPNFPQEKFPQERLSWENGGERVWSKELHLPSISPLFDSTRTEALTVPAAASHSSASISH